jgi:hypothetical protein
MPNSIQVSPIRRDAAFVQFRRRIRNGLVAEMEENHEKAMVSCGKFIPHWIYVLARGDFIMERRGYGFILTLNFRDI